MDLKPTLNLNEFKDLLSVRLSWTSYNDYNIVNAKIQSMKNKTTVEQHFG